jgi:hypothetical protein
MERGTDKRLFLIASFMFLILCLAVPPGFAAGRPNILVI